MQIKHFFDKDTYTLSYVVYDEMSKDAVIIDPLLDYEPQGAKISRESLESLLKFVDEKSLNILFILETHAHADHLTAAQDLKKKFPRAVLAIGEHITIVQSTFKKIFNFHSSFKTDGSQFDRLLKDNETVQAGTLCFKVIFTPGHTPACASYLFEDALFVGDALFMPDYGTGRCDFPAGSAEDLYASIKEKIYTLPAQTRIFVCHDYQPNGRKLEFQTTVAKEKEKNIQLKETTQKTEFVKFRSDRDKTLSPPKLLLPSIQVNIDAGKLPEPEENGQRYLKIPLS
jgi:glyoxylase-like metal-dependent hydrolase (beta-lactamase superfamily II)